MAIEKKIKIKIDAGDAKNQLQALVKVLEAKTRSSEKDEKQQAKAKETTKKTVKSIEQQVGLLSNLDRAVLKSSGTLNKFEQIQLKTDTAIRSVRKAAEEKKLTLKDMDKALLQINSRYQAQIDNLQGVARNTKKSTKVIEEQTSAAEMAAQRLSIWTSQFDQVDKNLAAKRKGLVAGLVEKDSKAYKEANSDLTNYYKNLEKESEKSEAKVTAAKKAEVKANERLEREKTKDAQAESRKRIAAIDREKDAALRSLSVRSKTSAASRSVSGVLGGAAAAFSLQGLSKTLDGYTELTNRIRIATDSERELIEVRERLIDISNETRSGIEDNSLLYLRLAKATEQAGVAQEDLLRITETVNKAVQLGGSSSQEAQGALRQFSQILSSGFKTGFSQELNSLAEQTPGLFNLIADGLAETSIEFQALQSEGQGAITILKKFSEEGIGDLDMLLKAISSQTDVVDQEFKKVTPTISKAVQVLKNSFQEYIGTADQANGITATIANTIELVAENLEDLGVAVAVVASIFAGKFVIGLAKTTAALVSAARAAKTLTGTIGLYVELALTLGSVVAGFVSLASVVRSAKKETDEYNESLVKSREELEKLTIRQTEAHLKRLQSRYEELTGSVESYEVASNLISEQGSANRSFDAEIARIKELEKVVSDAETEIESLNEDFGFYNENGGFELSSSVADLRITELSNGIINAEREIERLRNTIVEESALGDDVVDSILGRDVTDLTKERLAQIEKQIADTQTRLEKLRLDPTAQEFSAIELIDAERLKIRERERITKEFNDRIAALNKAANDLERDQFAEKASLARQLADELAILRDEALADLNDNNDKEAKSRLDRLNNIRDSIKSERQIIIEEYRENIAFLNKYKDELGITESEISEIVKRLAMLKDESLRALSGDPNESVAAIETVRRRLIEASQDEIDSINERFNKEKQLIQSNVSDYGERVSLLVQLEKERSDAINKIRDEDAEKEKERQKEAISTYVGLTADAITASVDFVKNGKDIKIDAIEKELNSEKGVSKERREFLEKEAESLFEKNKKLQKANIAINTAAGITRAFVDMPFPAAILASAAIAANGAAQWASVNATSYEAPTPPSSGKLSIPSSSSQNQGQNISINVTGNNFGNDANAGNNVVQAIKDAINDGEIIFDRASDQWALLQG